MDTNPADTPEYPRHDGYCPLCGAAIEADGLEFIYYEARWGCHECAAIWEDE
jgi:hypothetical protein